MLKHTQNINFIHVNMSRKDVERLFGPFEEGDIFVAFDDKESLEAIVVNHLGKFPSLSQARKNGWSQPIPPGFKEWKISKTKFWTCAPYDPDSSKEPHFWNKLSLVSECACDTPKQHNKQYHKQKFQYGDAAILGDEVAQLEALVPVYVCDDCGEGFTDEEGETLREEAVTNYKNSLAVKHPNLSST